MEQYYILHGTILYVSLSLSLYIYIYNTVWPEAPLHRVSGEALKLKGLKLGLKLKGLKLSKGFLSRSRIVKDSSLGVE